MRARLFAAATTLSLACGACVLVFGMDPLSERSAAADGGPDDAEVATDGPGPEAATCGTDSIDLPGRPNESSEVERPARYFAFSTLDLGIDRADGRPGFDLDGRKTFDLAANSCTLYAGGDPADTLRFAGDTDGGIDNASFELLQLLRSFVAALDPTRIDARLRAGYFGVVLRVDDWNHTANDRQVTLHPFPTIGYWEVPTDGGAVFWNREARPFDRDAGDLVMIDERFRGGTIGSSMASPFGWINDGTLVARFERFTLPVRSSVDELRPFDLEIRDAWLTAKLVTSGDGGVATLTHGRIGGRISASSFLTQASLIFDPQAGGALCSRVTTSTSGYLCNARDIRLSHCDDDKGLACDALSFGARFEATEIREDEIGPDRFRLDSDYEDKGQVPPSKRCPDLDPDAAIECPP
ncbi:MAG: hypothetical protein KF764_34385 [Labilithrix sp.]|nr:hypothetical protein [Labilithrix sp.]